MRVGGRIEIFRNPQLTTLGNLPQLTSVTGLFDLEYNPLITTVDVSNATFGGFWLMGNTGLTSVRLGPIPAQVTDAVINGSPLLTDIGPTGLSGLQNVSAMLVVGTTGLSSLGPTGLSNLMRVGGRLEIFRNPQLTTLGNLTQLTSVTGLFDLEYNPLITSLDLPVLTTLRDLYIAGNAGLTSLAIPALPSLGASLLINGNAALTAIVLSALGTVTFNFAVQSNASLCNSIPISIRAHTTVGGTTSISGNQTGC